MQNVILDTMPDHPIRARRLGPTWNGWQTPVLDLADVVELLDEMQAYRMIDREDSTLTVWFDDRDPDDLDALPIVTVDGVECVDFTIGGWVWTLPS